MNTLEFDPAYSAGVRDLLTATATTRPRSTRRRIWMGASVVVGLSVLGAGAAVAASSVLPGADIVTGIGSSHTVTGVGPAVIDVGTAPSGTNSLETSLACLSAGTLTWPDGSSVSCTTAGNRDVASESIPWTPDRASFSLGATPGTHWRLTYTFSHRQPTALATNAAGQTYGIDTGNAHPDLIAATATNGREGYIDSREAAELNGSDPSHFHTPAQAVHWQETHPNYSVDIPVYLSDGKTQIGVFRIGG